MQVGFNSKALLSSFEDFTHYSIKFSTNSNIQTSLKDVILVVDCSGSMASRMKTTIETLLKLADFLLKSNVSNISLIKFDSKSKIFYQVDKVNELKKIINSLSAGGGTCFSYAIQAISEIIIKSQNIKPFTSVIFLTDGEIENYFDSGNNFKNLKEEINNLNSNIMNFTKNFEIHALGVGRSHDPFLLDNLIKLGKGEGTYQYIESNENIENCFENIIKYFDNYINFQVILDSKSKIFPSKILSLEKFDDENYKINVESEGFLNFPLEKIQENDVILILTGKNYTDTFIPNIEKNLKLEPFDTLKFTFEKKKNQFMLIIDEILNNKKVKTLEDYEILSKEFNQLKSQFYISMQKIFKIPNPNRQILLEKIEPLQQKFIPQIEKLLNAAFKNQINNELIANVQALSYYDKFHSSLQKKVEKRVQMNAHVLNDVYDNVEKYSSTINKENLMNKYQSLIDDIGCCFLTCNNFLEAMLESDCLCITFNVTCNQYCLVDSNNMIINKIFPSFVSANSFLQSVKYALNIKPNSIGGFGHDENNKGTIFKGDAGEINACLPVFICPEHWEIASLLMKPILGWVLTLDPAGYTLSQKKVVPFILLEKTLEGYLENPKVTYQKKIFQILLETCMNILLGKENEKVLGMEVRENLLTYLLDPEIRCQKILNNSVFLLQIYCAIQNGCITKEDLKDFDKIFKKMCEEEMRKNQIKMNEFELAVNLKEILNITNEMIHNYGEMVVRHLKEKQKLLEEKKSEEEGKTDDDSIFKQKLMKINEIFQENKFSQNQQNLYDAQ